MATRIKQCFKQLAGTGKTALIPYIMAGDPTPDATVTLMNALVSGGANLIELGVPFSDPMADGPAIQGASMRALANEVSLHDVLNIVAQFRIHDTKTPVVLMTYQNPIEVMGPEQFVQSAVEVGVDGVLVVDLPIEEAGDLLKITEQNKVLDIIFLISPTTSAERLERISTVAHGFVYYVSLRGVTGAKHIDFDEIADKVEALKHIITLPVAVGFGIYDVASAVKVAQLADAVVIGSAIVRIIEQHVDRDYVQLITDFITQIRQAIDAERVNAIATG